MFDRLVLSRNKYFDSGSIQCPFLFILSVHLSFQFDELKCEEEMAGKCYKQSKVKISVFVEKLTDKIYQLG